VNELPWVTTLVTSVNASYTLQMMMMTLSLGDQQQLLTYIRTYQLAVKS